MTTPVAALRDLLAAAADRSPDAPALRVWSPAGWDTIGWARLRDAAMAAATAARELGEERVVLVLDNQVASVVGLLGLVVAGVGVLLVERDSSHLRDESSPVHRVGAKVVVGPDAVASAVRPPVRFVALGELVGPAAVSPVAPLRHDPDVLQLTSGSTGEPRVARQTLAGVLAGGAIYRDRYRLTPSDAVLLSVPMAHSFGLIGGLAAALVAGAGLLTLARFTLSGLEAALGVSATVLLGTPMVYDLAASALPLPGPGRALRTALTSGGPISDEARTRAAARLGCPVHTVYGSTETGLIASQFHREEPWPPGCVGAAAPGVTWRFEPGRFLVRTSTMFHGYMGQLRADLRPDGFYEIGDAAHADAAGHLFLDGRKDTFINVGGRKVNPRRIERLIGEHPGVREVVVYGVVDGDRGEEIRAAVVPAGQLATGDLLGWCRTRLSPYEVPHHLHLLDGLPRTGMGKVDRRRLPGRP